MATITVVVGEAPYGSQRVYTALRFSLVALHEEHKANLFLMEDGVFAAKAGQQPPEMPVGDAGMPNCEALVRAAIQEGLTVKACRVCCLERGLKQEEIVPGVELGLYAGPPQLGAAKRQNRVLVALASALTGDGSPGRPEITIVAQSRGVAIFRVRSAKHSGHSPVGMCLQEVATAVFQEDEAASPTVALQLADSMIRGT